uniref:Uncharacterized protein n=1 Tax=Tanacetum cinerariifolium TaxID=118510 RepID=A0A6L2M2T3_TANCI|nr:hypothetical protein [Tanacetum cinerariifolium]
MSLESFQPPVGGVAIREPPLSITRRLLVVEGKGKGIAIDEQAALSLLDLQKPKKKSITDQYIIQRWIPVTQDATTRPFAQPQDDTSANVIHDTLSPADAETEVDTENSNSKGYTKILNVDEERGRNFSNTLALEERTVELDEGQAASYPGNTLKSQPLPDEDQARSNHRQSYNPPSLFETLSSVKNLNYALTFGDQFINDTSPKDEPGKATVNTEVESMVTVPIHQASLSAPPLSTPIIDLTLTKLVSLPA